MPTGKYAGCFPAASCNGVSFNQACNAAINPALCLLVRRVEVGHGVCEDYVPCDESVKERDVSFAVNKRLGDKYLLRVIIWKGQHPTQRRRASSVHTETMGRPPATVPFRKLATLL